MYAHGRAARCCRRHHCATHRHTRTHLLLLSFSLTPSSSPLQPLLPAANHDVCCRICGIRERTRGTQPRPRPHVRSNGVGNGRRTCHGGGSTINTCYGSDSHPISSRVRYPPPFRRLPSRSREDKRPHQREVVCSRGRFSIQRCFAVETAGSIVPGFAARDCRLAGRP